MSSENFLYSEKKKQYFFFQCINNKRTRSCPGETAEIWYFRDFRATFFHAHSFILHFCCSWHLKTGWVRNYFPPCSPLPVLTIQFFLFLKGQKFKQNNFLMKTNNLFVQVHKRGWWRGVDSLQQPAGKCWSSCVFGGSGKWERTRSVETKKYVTANFALSSLSLKVLTVNSSKRWFVSNTLRKQYFWVDFLTCSWKN